MSPASSPQSILFFVPYGQWRVHNQLDALVAAALQVRGYAVDIITCDALYQPCAIRRTGQDCADCQASIKAMLRPWTLPSRTIGSVLSEDLVKRADEWIADIPDDRLVGAVHDDLPIGEWTVSSVKTHFRLSSNQELLAAQVVPVHRRFVRDTLLTYWAIERVLEERRPDAVFLFNARFYPYRAAFEAAQRHGVRILVHERGRVGNSFGFYENQTCLNPEPARQLARDWANVPLDAGEIERVDRYFFQKQRGVNSHWPAFYETVQKADPYEVLGIPRSARIVGVFTSSTDEFGHLPAYANANQQLTLIENAATALEGTDTYLVVRHHPGIGGAATDVVDVSSFYSAYEHAQHHFANVRIVMPSDALTSLALFPYMTAAIAPFSSIATETVAFGIPTLVSDISDAIVDDAYILRDFGASSVERALKFITSPTARLTAERLRRFYRFFYGTFFRPSIEFQAIGIKDFFEPLAHTTSITSLEPGKDPALDRICDHLLRGEPAYQRPSPADLSAPAAAEDTYIQRELELIANRQKTTLEQAVAKRRPSFAILLDSSVPGPMTAARWMQLPNSDNLTVRPFRQSAMPIGRYLLQAAAHCLHGNMPGQGFLAWRDGLLEALSHISEDYVIVTTAAAQFHDSSVVAISDRLHSAPGDATTVLLSGWGRVPEQAAPLRFATADALNDVLAQHEQADMVRFAGRLQHGLAFVAVRRAWLLQLLRQRLSPKEIERAVWEAIPNSPMTDSQADATYLMW
jgi:hypothetical protein